MTILILASCGGSDGMARDVRSAAARADIDGDAVNGHAVADVDEPLARLGRTLFFSKSLSGDFDVACASCHHPELAFTDGLPLPVGVASGTPSLVGPGRGVQPSFDRDPAADGGPNGRRNAPTTFNAGLYDRALGFDGRALSTGPLTPGGASGSIVTLDGFRSLDSAAGPSLITAFATNVVSQPHMMRGHATAAHETREAYRQRIVDRLRGTLADPRMLRNDWLAAFRAGYEDPTGTTDELVTWQNVTRALDAYMRAQMLSDTPFRRFLAGDDAALSHDAQLGAVDFLTPVALGGAGCVACHAGDHFTDESFRRVGFPQLGRGFREDRSDYGRAEVSRDDRDRFAFRVPSLLDVAKTAPYGHAGSFATLDAAVRYHMDAVRGAATYDVARDAPSELDPALYPGARALTLEAAASLDPEAPRLAEDEVRVERLVAFLEALTNRCLVDEACVARFVAPASDDPDGQLLVREPPGGVPVRADDPAPIDMTAATRIGLLPGRRIGCRPAPTPTARTGLFTNEAVARGIDHTHDFSGSEYLLALEESWVVAGVSGGDLDDDCHTDLVFAAGDVGGVRVYRGTPGGAFVRADTSLPAGIGGMFASSLIADLDGDRKAEIMLGNQRAGDAILLRGDAIAGFTEAQRYAMTRTTMSLTAGDLDGDLDLDLATTHWQLLPFVGGAPLLHRNLGGLAFTSADGGYRTTTNEILPNYLFAPAIVDFDRDGDADLLITGDYGTSLPMKQENGRMTSLRSPTFPTDENGMGSAIGDYDGDGDLDWFISSIYDPNQIAEDYWGLSGNRLYRNEGDGTFTDVTDAAGVRDGRWGWASCFADFDDDGDLDLYQENGYGWLSDEARLALDAATLLLVGLRTSEFSQQPARYFENRGDGTFAERALAVGFAPASNGRGIVCFDADRDGDVDIAVAAQGSPASLYINGTGTDASRHFLGVRLVGAAPNSDGIGATVRARVGSRTLVREANLFNHHASHDPPLVHFGLGPATVVDELRIDWPGAAEDTVLTGVRANHHVVVVHPEHDPVLHLTARERAALTRSLAAVEAALVGTPSTRESLLALAFEQSRRDVPGAPALLASFDALVATATPSAMAELESIRRAFVTPAPLDPGGRASLTGFAALFADALHCGERPLPADFGTAFAALTSTDPIGSLRVATLLDRAECGTPLAPAAYDTLLDDVALLATTATDSLTREALAALAALAFAGRLDRAPTRAVEFVLDSQLPDGTFAAACPREGACGPTDSAATSSAFEFLSGLVYRGHPLPDAPR